MDAITIEIMVIYLWVVRSARIALFARYFNDKTFI